MLILLNEATSWNFNEIPRGQEHVNKILTDVEGVDEEIGRVMNDFVSSWVLIAYQVAKKDFKKEDNAYTTSLYRKAAKKVEILKAWALKNR